jgi:hypothetical protein
MACTKWSYAGMLALAACAVLMFAHAAPAASGGGCDSDFRHSGYGTSVKACVSAVGSFGTAVPDAYVYVTPGLESSCTVTIVMTHNSYGPLTERTQPCVRSSGIVRYQGYRWTNLDSGAVHVNAYVTHYYNGAWRRASSWTPWLYFP